MINFFNKISNILIILIIGGVFFGLIKYVEYRFNLIENQLEISNKDNLSMKSNFQNKIKNLEEVVSGTKSSLTDVIQQGQEKSDLLESQFNEITNTVGVLSKLSLTDPELLKKYSKVYFLNEHYVPISLSDIGIDYRSTKSTNFQIHSDVLSHIEDLINAGNADGVAVRVQSAYRSFVTQTNLKATYKVTYGAGANKFSADQGYSEHQLGTAIDLTTVKTNGALEGFDKTPEYKWLLDNAYKYGFIISYPAGNIYYKFEPWHWRFVGVALATKLHDDNVGFYSTDQRIIDSYLGNIFD
ncbi:MAG: M15 family metallopeptidase [Candidatus Paceibacterota bacterium]|jgi:LAS superfamily LD-carboxypeptidase LdcB